MKKISIIFILAMMMFAGVGSQPAFALPIIADTASSTEGLGNFYGELTYTYNNSTNAQLIIDLTNTSPAQNGGFITAFAFVNPSHSITGVTLLSTDSDFGLIGGLSFNESINVAPFGDFSIGASTSSSWLGGGNPQKGIGVGDTETFTFQFIGSGLDSLTAGSFVGSSSAGLETSGSEGFVVRFRGFEDGGSDKVPAAHAPEPATMLLLGSGLVGLVGIGRKKFRKS